MPIVATKVGKRVWVHSNVTTGIPGVDFKLVDFGNINTPIAADTTVAALNALLTVNRTWTLPAANLVTAGRAITVVERGTNLNGKTLIIAPASGDLIDGQSSYNFTGGSVDFISTSDNWVAKDVGDFGEGPAGPSSAGSGILNGAIMPTAGDGAEGDYYLNVSNDTLYGPKASAGSYGAAQNGQNVGATPTPGYNYPTIEIATHVKLLVAGRITAVKYWREASATQVARKVNLWNPSSFVRLATGSVANDGGGAGWKTVALDTPYDAAALETVVVSVGSTSDYARVDSYTYPVTNGDVSLVNGAYGLALDTYPNVAASINFFTDVVFQKLTADIWPIAVSGFVDAPTDGKVYGRKGTAWAPSWVQMTQAAYDALTPKDANTLYVIVG
jgi:hypothetical protein